jgi:single-stranded-DNA-specific exonuclease
MQGLTRRWETPPATDPAKSLVGRILDARGIDENLEKSFLDPKLSNLEDPSSLPDAEKAAEILCNALRDGKKILIYGDYDADGITASTVLYHIIATATNREGPPIYIPDRVDEGYGINVEAMERFKNEGIDLVISVDCGVSAIEAAKRAKELGIELIVTDHHKPREDGVLPDCCAIVHPSIKGEPLTPYAGVGVAYQLSWAFARTWSGSKKVNKELSSCLLEMLPFVAIGTIADMVPLVNSNRILARWGLQLLPSTQNSGLRAIMKNIKTPSKNLNSSHISFGIAPLLNAVGRLAHAATAVDLLTHLDGTLADSATSELSAKNTKRRREQRVICDEALLQIEKQGLNKQKIICLQNENWNRGVVGVAAGKCIEKHYIPTILLSGDGDELTGSARSISGFSILDALNACKENLEKFGGHDMAAGLTLKKENFEEFVSSITSYANEHISDEQLVKTIKPDVLAELREVHIKNLKQIEKMGPFGIGNPAPIVQIMGAKVDESKAIGGGGAHLSLKVGSARERVRCLWWNNGEFSSQIKRGTVIDIVGKLKLNEFSNIETAEIDVLDIALPSS